MCIMQILSIVGAIGVKDIDYEHEEITKIFEKAGKAEKISPEEVARIKKTILDD